MVKTCSILITIYSIVSQNHAKQFLIKTRVNNVSEAVTKGSHDENVGYDDGQDYMAVARVKTVQFGAPFELRCNSDRDIEKCYFSKKDVIYRVRKGSSFNQKRLQCLCDVSFLVSNMLYYSCLQ